MNKITSLSKWLKLLVCMLACTTHYMMALEIYDIRGDWPERQIEKELSFLQEIHVTDDTIISYPSRSGIYRYQIKEGQVTSEVDPECMHEMLEERNRVILASIEQVLEVASLPNMTFLVDLGDACFHRSEDDMMPIFVFSKKQDYQAQILLPCWEIFNDMQQPWGRLAKASKASLYHPWHRKSPIAFWRGATTGCFAFDRAASSIDSSFASNRWRELPRAQLVFAARDSEGRVDAKFTNYCQGDRIHPEVYQEFGLPARHCDMNTHMAFKYLIDIDGNSYGTRLEWAMASNCMPIRVEGLWSLWYYEGLEPYKHYLPVKGDCSDLVEVVKWAQRHDKEAYQIAKQSQKFANKYFTEDAVASYIYHLLLRYSKLID